LRLFRRVVARVGDCGHDPLTQGRGSVRRMIDIDKALSRWARVGHIRASARKAANGHVGVPQWRCPPAHGPPCVT
jgi:hypothetical protein